MKRLMPSLAAAALLAGCINVGPDYHLPEKARINDSNAQGAFKAAAGVDAVSTRPLPDNWWQLYNDERLNQLEREALSTNTDLRVAAANLQRYADLAEAAEDANELELGAQGSYARTQLSGESYLLNHSLPPYDLTNSGLKVSYDLDLFGRLRRAAEAARGDEEAALDGLDLARINVAAAVARSYIEACDAGAELDSAERSLQVQEQTLDVQKRLVNAGRESQLVVSHTQALVDQLRAAPPPLQKKRQLSLYRLAVLVGRTPEQFPPELASCTESPHLSQPIPVGNGAELLRRRPDVRQAERQLAAATARIGVSIAELYPDITIGMSGGYNGFITDIGKAAAQQWSLGSMISWHLPTGGDRARIKAAGAAQQAALAHFDGVVLNALRETDSALTSYAMDLQRNESLRNARDSARLFAHQAEQLYEAGRNPLLVGLGAQQNETSAEAALVASDSQVAADQVELFLALGGGWTKADAEAGPDAKTAETPAGKPADNAQAAAAGKAP